MARGATTTSAPWSSSRTAVSIMCDPASNPSVALPGDGRSPWSTMLQRSDADAATHTFAILGTFMREVVDVLNPRKASAPPGHLRLVWLMMRYSDERRWYA